MAQILNFPRRLSVFAPEHTTVMGSAYDDAITTLDVGVQSEAFIRELIAKRIIRMARSGDFDPEQLRSSALRGFRRTRFG